MQSNVKAVKYGRQTFERFVWTAPDVNRENHQVWKNALWQIEIQVSRLRTEVCIEHNQATYWCRHAKLGLQKLHSNSQIPLKKPKGGSLSKEDKRFNRQLARQRIAIEHVNRRLKIFKILSLPYRNRRRRFGLRCNLISAIYNFEVGLSAAKSSISPP